jgi:hypothetical protein
MHSCWCAGADGGVSATGIPKMPVAGACLAQPVNTNYGGDVQQAARRWVPWKQVSSAVVSWQGSAARVTGLA